MNQTPTEVEHVNTHEMNAHDKEDINRDPSPMLTDGAGVRYVYLTYDKLASGSITSLMK